MPPSTNEKTITRRTALRGAAGAVTGSIALKTTEPVAAQASGEPNYGGWFEDTSNYDGTADKTGQQTVTITVGAEGNDGNYAFDPAAVRVDPGSTVVWEWSGDGGVHNVVSEGDTFESEMTDKAGFTFEQTIESTGVSKYVCVPHEAMGMKGALVVGDSQGSNATNGAIGDALAIGGGLGLVGVLLAMFAFGTRSATRKHGRDAE